MTKRILFGLIICSLISALVITGQRISVEQNNQTVELIADFQDFAKLTSSDLTMEMILEQLSVLGVSKIALSEVTVGSNLLEGHTFDYHGYQNPDILSEPLGFKQQEIDMIRKTRLEPVPKVLDGDFIDFSLRDKLQGLDTSLVIFSGNQVIGFPDKLVETQETLENTGLNIGLVEFSNQKGMGNITNATNVVRVHAINNSEMNVLSKERIVNRYLRAVRERNIRAIYLRPFVESWDQTVELIEEIVQVLSKTGYPLGHARPYQQWQPGIFYIWLCFQGVLAASVLLGQRFFNIPKKVLWSGLVVAGLFAFISLNYNFVLTQQACALLAAIVFPSLAIVSHDYSKKSLVKSYLKITSISLAGGILIVGLLSGSNFLVKLAEFRGVKLMHLLPVLIAFVYGVCLDYLPIRSWNELKQGFTRLWNSNLPVKYLAGIFVVMGLAGIYILRTGNFGLPILDMEIQLREFLEKLLMVRPRTKEFMIGFPGLYLLLASRKPHPLLLSVAVVGQLSLVNTFTHIHTPILLSLLRTSYSIVIGYLVGWVFFQGYQKFKRRLDNDSRFRVLRLPE